MKKWEVQMFVGKKMEVQVNINMENVYGLNL